MTKRELFAVRLKELRQEAGLTQKQLAEKAGMSLAGLAHLEHGLREPTWPTVLAVADALGVECTAFTEASKGQPAQGRGRPPKVKRSRDRSR